MSQRELDALLIGAQSDRDTKRDDLDHEDFFAAGNDFSLDFKQGNSSLAVTTGSFGKHARIPGVAEVNLKAFSYLSHAGVADPMFSNLLMSCGFKKTNGITDMRTFTPSSIQTDWTYLSAWKYTGAVSGESLVTKAYSILCDGTIEGSLGEPIKISCTGKGVADGAPTYDYCIEDAIVPPTDTIPVMIKASIMEAMGFPWDILKFSVAFKNNVINKKENDVAFPFGYRYADITDRDFEIKMTVYQSADIPYPALNAGTIGSFDIKVGNTPAFARIYSPATGFQITDVEPGVDAGQNTFEITGTIEYEDFAIVTGAV
jgi:hypothetical protein